MTQSTMTPPIASSDASASFDSIGYKDIAQETTSAPMADDDPQYRLVIDENVVEKIASRAASEIDGIIDMKGSVLSRIQEGFGGSDKSKGVDADVVDDNNATVELSIVMEYGKSAPDIFAEVKQVICDDIQEMTGLSVAEMTVNVVDVMTKDEFDQKQSNSLLGGSADQNPVKDIANTHD